MKCEICKIIAAHGLEPSAHDLWFCVDGKSKPSLLARLQAAPLWHRLNEGLINLTAFVQSLAVAESWQLREGLAAIAHPRPGNKRVSQPW